MNSLIKKAKSNKVGLVLGGGGSRGAYECGVIKALDQLGVKADVVVGTSVGSLIGACYAQKEVEAAIEMWLHMETDTVFDICSNPSNIDYFREFVRHGGASSTPLRKGLDIYMDEDKIRKSPMEYGLVTTEFPSMNPRYLWKEDIPKGRLLDFMAASCAAFPAIHTYEIDGTTYIDGGYSNNLPVFMARQKNAKFIIAVELDRNDSVKVPEGPSDETYILIRPKFELGFILSFQVENTKRAMILGYLDTLKAFKILDGEKYTFKRGEFKDNELTQLDYLCEIFEVIPTKLYDKNKINDALIKQTSIFRSNYTKAVENRLSTLVSLASFGSLRSISLRGHLVLYILDSFRQYGTDSIFATKHLMRILPDEIRAARYLLNHGIG